MKEGVVVYLTLPEDFAATNLALSYLSRFKSDSFEFTLRYQGVRILLRCLLLGLLTWMISKIGLANFLNAIKDAVPLLHTLMPLHDVADFAFIHDFR
jgi:hypothetical protein